MLVIGALAVGDARYSDLDTTIPAISRRMLTLTGHVRQEHRTRRRPRRGRQGGHQHREAARPAQAVRRPRDLVPLGVGENGKPLHRVCVTGRSAAPAGVRGRGTVSPRSRRLSISRRRVPYGYTLDQNSASGRAGPRR
ncbi:hypothetical protein [Streptomyces sp. NPDC058542]|uniref:hypothetical protein n=1 Tax=Streptomyces sp. NPDC058542 TaxID=3346543 RepID=UPI00365AD028